MKRLYGAMTELSILEIAVVVYSATTLMLLALTVIWRDE